MSVCLLYTFYDVKTSALMCCGCQSGCCYDQGCLFD